MQNKFLKIFFPVNDKETPQLVIDRISGDAVFKGTNLLVLVFAIFLASLGLNTNSTAVIIGAMLISPLMGPIMGMGLAVGINDLQLLKISAKNFAFAILVSLITSTIYFAITPLDEAYSELLARTSPTIYDVLIALLGGLAGIVTTASTRKGNVIPGVAIATALMPPLCTAGYGLANFNMKFFLGAFYLFTINTVFIALATFLTTRALKYPVKHLLDPKDDLHSHRIIIAIVLLTLIPSIYFGYEIVQQQKFIKKANLFIDTHSEIEGNYLLNKNIDASGKVITLIYGGRELPANFTKELQKQLAKYGLENTSLIIRQGFSTLDYNKESYNVSLLNRTLAEKEQEIRTLKLISDSVSTTREITRQLYNELKVQYSHISAVSVNPYTISSDSMINDHTIVLIKASKFITQAVQNKMNEWLKVRLRSENISLLIAK